MEWKGVLAISKSFLCIDLRVIWPMLLLTIDTCVITIYTPVLYRYTLTSAIVSPTRARHGNRRLGVHLNAGGGFRPTCRRRSAAHDHRIQALLRRRLIGPQPRPPGGHHRGMSPPPTPPPPSVMGVSPRRLAAAIGKSRRDVTSSSTMAASEGGRDGDAGVRGDSCRPSARRNAAPGCCWSALDKSWEFSFSEKKSASEIVAYDSAFLFWIQLLLPSLSFFDTTAVAS